MTNTQNEPVEVTQADRDAMADAVRDAFRWDDSELAAIRRGDRDDRVIVQAFAKHRLSASSAVVDALRESKEGWDNVVEMGLLPRQHHDTARALSDKCSTALANTPKQTKPWCETCGKDVHEVLCPTCAKWWNDNPPPNGEQSAGLVEAVKDRLRGEPGDEYTDAGMEDAFFRWPVIERAILAALEGDRP